MIQTNNMLLQKTEQAIQSRVGPGIMNAYQRIISAGTAMMYSSKFHDEILKQLHLPGDKMTNAGVGVAKLMGLLIAQSKNTMLTRAALPAIGPAATVLLCEGLDYMEKSKMIKQVTPDMLAKATHEMSSALMQLLGVTPQKLAAAGALAKHAQPVPAGGPQGTPTPQAAPTPPTPQPQAQGGIIAGAMGGQ